MVPFQIVCACQNCGGSWQAICHTRVGKIMVNVLGQPRQKPSPLAFIEEKLNMHELVSRRTWLLSFFFFLLTNNKTRYLILSLSSQGVQELPTYRHTTQTVRKTSSQEEDDCCSTVLSRSLRQRTVSVNSTLCS